MIDPILRRHLVCPRDGQPLETSADMLVCPDGHKYPVVDGVPVFLLGEAKQTLHVAGASLAAAGQAQFQHPAHAELFLETLGLNAEEKESIRLAAASGSTRIDPVISHLIAATNGNAYRHLIGKLENYPIPEIRAPRSNGKLLLDIGCNWGRWCIAAAGRGYHPIGIDPSLGAVMAAQRLARQRGVSASFVVGDARFLPFRAGTFTVVHSYSVLQHLAVSDVETAVAEIGRVLADDGVTVVQMPIKFGARCIYQQARRGFRRPRGFEVRYWTIPALQKLYGAHVGPVRIEVDCFFGIGLQLCDRPFMQLHQKMAVSASEMLRKLSMIAPPVTYLADSVYVISQKPAGAAKRNVVGTA